MVAVNPWVRIWTRLFLLASLAALVTCDDDPTGPRRIHGVATVTIVPASQAVPPGDTVRLVAEVRDTGGRLMPDEPVTWGSSSPAVARVDATGLLTGVTEGSATITATAGRARGTSAVKVSAFVINPDAVLIDSTSVRLISMDTVTGVWVFQVVNGPAPDLDSLSLIVGAEGEGFLRHVDAVQRQGDLIYLETSQAGIADLVQSGAVTISGRMDGEAGQIGTTWWDEGRLTYLNPAVARTANALNLDGVKLSLRPTPGDEGWSANATLEIRKGTIGFSPSIQGDLDWGFLSKLRKVEFALGGTFEFDIDDYNLLIQGAHKAGLDTTFRRQLVCQRFRHPTKPREKQCSSFSDETELFEYKRRFVTWFGAFPLVGVATLSTRLAADVSFSGDISWSGQYHANIPVKLGVGWNGSFYNLSSASREDASSSMTYQGMDGTVTLKLSLVPSLYIAFYGVAGPVMLLDGYGKGELGATFPIGPYRSLDVDLAAGVGINGTAGLRISLFKLIARRSVKGKGNWPLDFTKTWEIWGSYYPWVEWFTDGPLAVKLDAAAGGADVPPSLPLRLRPAFEVHDPPGGRTHGSSTQDVAAPTAGVHTFGDVRSGGRYLHQVSVPREALQGNCAVTSANPDTAMVRSDLYLSLGGTPDTTSFTIACIPLGDLRVRTTANGSDLPARFLITYRRADTVGADSRRDSVWVPAAGDTVLEDFVPASSATGATGEYRLSLDPGALNCAAAHPDTSQVFIQSGDTVSTHFTVHCVPLGQLRVTAPTTDPEAATGGPASYTLSVQPADPGVVMSGTTTLAANDSATFAGLMPLYGASGATGGYSVTLALPGNRCSLAAGARRVTVLPGDTALADFPVTCVERLFVRTTAAGPGRDADGFEVQLDGTPLGRIGSGATQGFSGVPTGDRVVRLADVDAACFVSEGGVARDVAAVTVRAWDSTLVAFTITCPAPGPPTLTATAVSTSEISLGWSILAPPRSVAFYRIYRGGVLVDSSTGTAWQDSGLPASTSFTYGVRAVTGGGVEGPMATATARTFDPPKPATGDLEVTTASTGVTRAYVVVVEGTGYRQQREIGANDRALFAGLTPAPYAVILRATGCTVTAPNPRTETVAAGQTTRTAFAVDCPVR